MIEAPGSHSMSRSLSTGEVVADHTPNQRYGGSAVKKVSELTLQLCLQHSDTIRVVSDVTDEDVDILASSYEMDRKNTLLTHKGYERTSLVAFAGLEHIQNEFPGEETVVIGTGHNAASY